MPLNTLISTFCLLLWQIILDIIDKPINYNPTLQALSAVTSRDNITFRRKGSKAKIYPCSSFSGNVNQKVLPLPTSLFTPICPLCFLMISALMYRPRPSP
jgi:hypothetical protein